MENVCLTVVVGAYVLYACMNDLGEMYLLLYKKINYLLLLLAFRLHFPARVRWSGGNFVAKFDSVPVLPELVYD